MTDVRWRAVLAPIGVPADRLPEDGRGLAKAVGLAGLGTPPDSLHPVFERDDHALQLLLGMVDELVVDGDPQVLRAAGYLVDPSEDLLRAIRDKRVHPGFDLRDVVGMGSMVTAATFDKLTLQLFDHPVDPYAVWRPDTFTATFELVDDEPVSA